MKKIIVTLWAVMIMLPAFCQEKDLTKDVTMVSYEQRKGDGEGKLALKNNTEVVIIDVVFQLTYLDKSGTPLDSADFKEWVYADPGKTAVLDIPAYQFERDDYRSGNNSSDSLDFKVEFELKNYNTDSLAVKGSDKSSLVSFLETMFIIASVLAIWIVLYYLVAVMAIKRNRSVIKWLLLSFLITPLLAALILLVAGEKGGVKG